MRTIGEMKIRPEGTGLETILTIASSRSTSKMRVTKRPTSVSWRVDVRSKTWVMCRTTRIRLTLVVVTLTTTLTEQLSSVTPDEVILDDPS